ncbi:MAG: glycoside hydrolase family 15 protein, partial [Vulcanimicrobiaceae bacterium]
VGFELAYYPSNEPVPESLHVAESIEATDTWWKNWSKQCTYEGRWREAVVRSLITLKALTFDPTGGIVAAPTTSLPEELGGVRNWDYRFCWLRDSTFVLYALLGAGFHEGAAAWRDWLLRAIAGAPDRLQIVYGLGGERRMPEAELSWLPGYADSKPVRTGNGAVDQFQLDVYGEVLDSMYQANRAGIAPTEDSWAMLRIVVDALEQRWRMPDRGLWEVRGGLQHFTHSKVLAWVGFDRAIKTAERFKLDGPTDRWRTNRRELHDQICRYGYDPVRNTFTQFYGSQELDASSLLIPLVGFLRASDSRVAGTVAAIERELGVDGFVLRYAQQAENSVDGLPGGEGAFLACNFWLVDNYVLAGKREKAVALFERLLGIRNDLGLLAEEYDPKVKRLVGNFPQAFSHVGLINSA